MSPIVQNPFPEIEPPLASIEEGIADATLVTSEMAVEEDVTPPFEEEAESVPSQPLQRSPRRRTRQLKLPEAIAEARKQMTPAQRLLILDTWNRSGLPAGDFAALVGVSKHTLYLWKSRFEAQGPAGLMDQQRGARGSRLSDLTQRTILMLKKSHPEWGTQRISDELVRGPGLSASASAVATVLHEAGYELEETPTRPHPDKVRSFERAAPNQLWQSDLFTFMLKRQNQRLHLVAFMDDHSRFIVSYGLHASQSGALVIEVFKAGIAAYGAPQEVLTDNGAQYVTWRGTSQFALECRKRGVKQIVATPRRPQTLGKVERFWGTLWREFLEAAIFADLSEARLRIGHYIDHYNFQRPHQSLDGLVPADRFFGAAPAMKKTLAARVANNALELARGGVPKAPLYLAGNVGGAAVTLHSEGDKVVLRHGDQKAEIALNLPSGSTLPEPVSGQPTIAPQAAEGHPDSPWTGAQLQAPGTSALDALGVPVSDAPEMAAQGEGVAHE